MLKFFRSAIAGIALLLSGGAYAQAQPKPTDADPALWVVKDADTTIYLFGTIHILKPGLTWFDEAVKTAFDSSDTLALEMVQPPADEMRALVMRKGTLSPSDKPLSEQLPEGARARYAAALTGLGMPPAAFDRIKPWFAATTLTMLPLMKLGFDPARGVEPNLTEAAKAAGKKIVGLETAEQQIGYLDGMSTPAQITFLTNTIDEMPKLGGTIDKMIGEWSAGDADGIAAEMNDDRDGSPESAATLLYDRNARWADWIDARLKTPGTVFVAVGAGHLAGPKSVQAELAKRGVTATRVVY
ncbi:TraB/GumN family protein [soil metagenome]